MDDTRAVQSRNPGDQLNADFCPLAGTRFRRRSQALIEGFARQQLHGEEQERGRGLVAVIDLVDGAQMRVNHPPRENDLLHEAR